LTIFDKNLAAKKEGAQSVIIEEIVN